MVNIAKKKLPSAAIIALVYLSYCAMNWYVMRGTMAYYGERFGWKGWFANDIWAFFLGGIVPALIYEFLLWFVFARLSRLGGDVASVKYGLNYAVIGANILLFALKFIYLAAPLHALMLNIILDPIVTLVFVGLYLWYAFYMNYVDKSVYRFVITQVFGMFLTVYGLVAFAELLAAVI